MKQPVEFKKVREFGDIIGDTFLFIKQNFKPLMKAFLYMSGVFIVGSMLSALMMQLNIVGANGSLGLQNYYQGSPWDKIYAFGLSYILLIIFISLAYTSMYVTVLSYISIYIQKGNQAPEVAEVWAYFKYYFFRIFGNGILISIFTGLCFVCCLIPGIYVFPAFSLFFPIMIIENAGFSYSFNRSFKLLKENWWITAATLFVIYVIFYAFSLVVQLPAYIILMLSAFTHAEAPITKTYAIIVSISQYAAQIFIIIPIIGSTLCYFNLVERKESLGLLGRIDEFGQNTKDNSVPEEY